MTANTAPATIAPDQPVPDEFDLLCESCGYSLVGLMVDRCPECGEPFDPAQLPLARIPWLYRKRLGKVMTHLQTARLVISRPRLFARELCRPVRISGSDAHAFRLRAIRIAASAPIVPVVAGIHQQMTPAAPWSVWLGVGLLCALGWVLLTVWFRLATDLPTFIWSGLPGRSDDLSPLHHYACAPLVLLPLSGLFATLAIFLLDNYLFDPSGEPTPLALLMIALVLLPVALAVWIIPLILMKTATGCGPIRLWMLALYLPVHWLIMSLLVGLGAIVLTVAIAGAAEIVF